MTHSIIVGGTRGLGRVVARILAVRGDVVSVIGRTNTRAASERRVRFYVADVRDSAATRAALDRLLKDGGKVNYCVFLQRYRDAGDEWDGEFHTTLTATRNIIEHIVPHFSAKADKAILAVSSVYSKYAGDSQGVSYHVAKAALDQMMRYYALTLGPKRIRVNSIMPSTFLKDESRSYYERNKQLRQLLEKITPLNRIGTADDCANVIAFLCSPQASFVTGQSLMVDGGLSLHWPESLARRIQKI